MPKYLLIIPVVCLLFLGCKKDKPNPGPANSNDIKITVVSGNNQTAQLGYPVSDSIVIKVTSNGVVAKNFEVQLIGSGCNEDLLTTLHTNADGIVKYSWTLAADHGTETLRAVAINENKRVDSVSLNASAITNNGRPNKSACVPNPGALALSIKQLSTGRLIACFGGKTYIRYSDDNGFSWHALKGFGPNHTVTILAVTPQDEIFAVTLNEGIFYSKDTGDTWANITPPALDIADVINDIQYLNSGKLIITGLPKDIFISSDKGKTWSPAGNGLNSGAGYQSPLELSNGDVYLLSLTNILYKSSDAGKTWAAQTNVQTERVMAICSDNNGWLYKASNFITNEAIVLSKDNGLTFTNFLTYNTPTNVPYITSMSVQPDGYFYFSQLGYAISRIDKLNIITSTYALTQAPFPAYIVTKNNTFLYTTMDGIFYYK